MTWNELSLYFGLHHNTFAVMKNQQKNKFNYIFKDNGIDKSNRVNQYRKYIIEESEYIDKCIKLHQEFDIYVKGSFTNYLIHLNEYSTPHQAHSFIKSLYYTGEQQTKRFDYFLKLKRVANSIELEQVKDVADMLYDKKQRPIQVVAYHIDGTKFMSFRSFKQARENGYYPQGIRTSILRNKPYCDLLWRLK